MAKRCKSDHKIVWIYFSECPTLFFRLKLFVARVICGSKVQICVSFKKKQQDGSLGPFSSPLRAILFMITSIFGGLDHEGTFYTDSPSGRPIGTEYQTLAFIIWFVSLIIVSVLYNNLLVSEPSGQGTLQIKAGANIQG